MSIENLDILEDKWRIFWENYPEEHAQLSILEAKIAYTFQDRSFLYEAMVHRSAILHPLTTKEKNPLPWNERLEFLGDSVLGLIISSLLWQRESLDEGQLSQVKASLVSEASLARLAKHLGLHNCLTVGRVEKKVESHLRPSLLADALEALIGAMYLDSSYDCVSEHVQTWFTEFFPIDEDVQDAKTRLQELFQGRYQKVPQYVTLEEKGPDHAKTFRVAVVFDGQTLAEADGSSKKRASQAAAKLVLETFPVLKKVEELC